MADTTRSSLTQAYMHASPADVELKPVAAAEAGADWPQLGLTVNVRHAEGLAENELCGTRPVGKAGVVRNSLRVWDGGLRGLGALNVFAAAGSSGSSGVMTEAVARRVNGDPTNPFWISLSNDTRQG